jgi:hypothetical protein
MKKINHKILSFILTIMLIIPIFQDAYAAEYSPWYIDQLLDLNYWIEEYDLELEYIDYIYFSNPQTQAIFENFKEVNRILKDEIIRKYRAWEFEYYQTKWIITNQKMFVYHTNKFFHYLSIKEQNPEYIETDNFILKNYSNMRIYYNRLRHLVNK